VRVVWVPVGELVLLDAVPLDDPQLADRLSGLARNAGLVPQASGIQATVRSQGVLLKSKGDRGWTGTDLLVGADGSIVVESEEVGEGMLGSGQIAHQRVEQLVSARADMRRRRGCTWTPGAGCARSALRLGSRRQTTSCT
jgi:hypothetical protein